MSTPAIITVAITGSQPSKAQNPAVPIHPAEQVESTHEAFEAGASLVHIHVRDPEGKSSSDISDVLSISPRTVQKHLERIYDKLGVETRSAAAAIAIRVIGR